MNDAATASTAGTGTRALRHSRNEFIQMMRFVAAALVLVTHATFYYHERIDSTLPIWHPGGIGVPIFFVISGFVMVVASARLTADVGGARQFMVRRLIRIVPLYWLVTGAKVAIALAVPSVINHNHFDLLYAIKSFLFIPAYNAAGEVRPIHGVGWTLLHEMFFYLVFAAVMLLRGRPVLHASIFIFAMYGVGLVIPPASALMEVLTNPINLNFVVGMLLGHAALTGGARSPGAQLLLAGLAVLAVLAWVLSPGQGAPSIPLDAPVLLLGCAMLLLASWKAPASFNAAVALGDSSYALYLFHPLIAPPVLILLHRVIPGAGAMVVISLAVAVTVLLAHMVHVAIERPLTRWASRWLGNPSRRVPKIGGAT